MIERAELKWRLVAADTDEDYAAVAEWLIEQGGLSHRAAYELVAVERQIELGELLPDEVG